MADEKLKRYLVNEIFHSVQGEGVLAGVPMTFIRFSKCNLACAMEPGEKSPGGFDCDTEFESGVRMTLAEIEVAVWGATGRCRVCGCTEDEAGCSWVQPGLCSACRATTAAFSPMPKHWLLLTGGEPALQLDVEFCQYFRGRGYRLAVETNGSRRLPVTHGSEGRLVEPGLSIENRLRCFPLDHITVSPKVAEHAIRQPWAHELRYVRGYGQGIPRNSKTKALRCLISPASDGDKINVRAARWCIRLVTDNPGWTLSVQMHKAWVVR